MKKVCDRKKAYDWDHDGRNQAFSHLVTEKIMFEFQVTSKLFLGDFLTEEIKLAISDITKIEYYRD